MDPVQRVKAALGFLDMPRPQYNNYPMANTDLEFANCTNINQPFFFPAFVSRISTYRPQDWCSAPKAAVCLAKHGFISVTKNEVQCCGCKVEIIVSYSWGKKEIEDVALNSHAVACKWKVLSTPEEFFRLPSNPNFIFQNFRRNCMDLMNLGTQLPIYRPEKLKPTMKIPEDFIRVVLKLFDVFVGDVQISAVVLGLCGWMKRSNLTFQCNFCQRTCAVWNFFSVEDVEWKIDPDEITHDEINDVNSCTVTSVKDDNRIRRSTGAKKNLKIRRDSNYDCKEKSCKITDSINGKTKRQIQFKENAFDRSASDNSSENESQYDTDHVTTRTCEYLSCSSSGTSLSHSQHTDETEKSAALIGNINLPVSNVCVADSTKRLNSPVNFQIPSNGTPQQNVFVDNGEKLFSESELTKNVHDQLNNFLEKNSENHDNSIGNLIDHEVLNTSNVSEIADDDSNVITIDKTFDESMNQSTIDCEAPSSKIEVQFSNSWLSNISEMQITDICANISPEVGEVTGPAISSVVGEYTMYWVNNNNNNHENRVSSNNKHFFNLADCTSNFKIVSNERIDEDKIDISDQSTITNFSLYSNNRYPKDCFKSSLYYGKYCVNTIFWNAGKSKTKALKFLRHQAGRKNSKVSPELWENVHQNKLEEDDNSFFLISEEERPFEELDDSTCQHRVKYDENYSWSKRDINISLNSQSKLNQIKCDVLYEKSNCNNDNNEENDTSYNVKETETYDYDDKQKLYTGGGEIKSVFAESPKQVLNSHLSDDVNVENESKLGNCTIGSNVIALVKVTECAENLDEIAAQSHSTNYSSHNLNICNNDIDENFLIHEIPQDLDASGCSVLNFQNEFVNNINATSSTNYILEKDVNFTTSSCLSQSAENVENFSSSPGPQVFLLTKTCMNDAVVLHNVLNDNSLTLSVVHKSDNFSEEGQDLVPNIVNNSVSKVSCETEVDSITSFDPDDVLPESKEINAIEPIAVNPVTDISENCSGNLKSPLEDNSELHELTSVLPATSISPLEQTEKDTTITDNIEQNPVVIPPSSEPRTTKRKLEEIDVTDNSEIPLKTPKIQNEKSFFHPELEHHFWCVWRSKHRYLDKYSDPKSGWEALYDVIKKNAEIKETERKWNEFSQVIHCISTIWNL